jgi:hypothetical protein
MGLTLYAAKAQAVAHCGPANTAYLISIFSPIVNIQNLFAILLFSWSSTPHLFPCFLFTAKLDYIKKLICYPVRLQIRSLTLSDIILETKTQKPGTHILRTLLVADQETVMLPVRAALFRQGNGE